MKTRLNPKIIRANDRVRIIKPIFVTRVGYPKSINDYLPDAEKEFGAEFKKRFGEHIADKILREIAYGMAKKNGFGGAQRSLHTVERPEWNGKELWVHSVRSAQSGVYYPPCSSQTYYGEYDYDPGGLADVKVHRLALLDGAFHFGLSKIGNMSGLEIEVCNLEKIS